ncbi:coiled-coil domain-containing protein 9B isoform X2 [Stigmatopora argus]
MERAERATPCDLTPRRVHERDLELDKKIEALRRKNEALMKRYKEVEEDKKRAEEDGMALLSRKGKADDLTITVNKSTCESRVVVTKFSNTASPVTKGQVEEGLWKEISLRAAGSVGRGHHKKQLIVTMAGKKGKRVVCEKPEKMPDSTCLSDVKSPADEEQAGNAKQACHMTTLDSPPQDLEISDLNVPTSKEEQEEYLQWKKEREKIDKERVARHKNAKGQWRRAWDVDKTDNMFSDKSQPEKDCVPPSRAGGRSPRRRQHRSGTDTQGHEKRGKDKSSKNLQVMGSNAKGKDRLTGRARRWQDQVESENVESSDVPFEEFLEKFDALTDTEAEEQTAQDSKTLLPDISNSLEVESGSESSSALGADTSVQDNADASPRRASEKKVRFSQELIQGAHAKQITGSQDSASAESSPTSFLKGSLQKKNQLEVPRLCVEGAKEDEKSHCRQQASESECTKKKIGVPTAPCGPPVEKASASLLERSVQLADTNADEPIDSCVCVLSLESGELHPEHFSCSDKAREHGKIV